MRMSFPFRMRLALSAVAAVIVAMSGLTSAQILYPLYDGYNLVDLGVNMPGWNFAYAINNNGQVVGDMQQWGGSLTAFRSQANQPMTSSDGLGVLSGDYRSYAWALDNNGYVYGESVHNNSYIQSRGYRWGYNGAVMEDLHPTAFTATNSSYRGTNDYGWNVGYYTTGKFGTPHALISFGSPYTYQMDTWLSSPAPYSSAAFDSNNLDQMVGWMSQYSTSQPRAFMFDAAANVWRRMDIPTLSGGIWNKAYAINESSQIVGESDKWVGTSRWTHAFLFRDANKNYVIDTGELVDLDVNNSTQSAALAINNSGVAVGYSGSPDIVYGNSRAMQFSGGTMVDLNTQVKNGLNGWILRSATGINSGGQIVGWMETSGPDQQSRVRHAFRLDPAPTRIIILR
jgi:probable HAF family extracellular repeat protein